MLIFITANSAELIWKIKLFVNKLIIKQETHLATNIVQGGFHPVTTSNSIYVKC